MTATLRKHPYRLHHFGTECLWQLIFGEQFFCDSMLKMPLSAIKKNHSTA
jgi:hypothetical protein